MMNRKEKRRPEKHGRFSRRHLMKSASTPQLLALNPKLINSMNTSPLATGKIRVALR